MSTQRRSRLQFLPVSLLVLAIAVYGFRIAAVDADPQRGSAFAMFATVDIGATRRVMVSVPGDPDLTIKIPDELARERQRLVGEPTENSARHFASLLLDHTWTLEDETATVGGDVQFAQVHVQVVGLKADGRVLTRQVFATVLVGADEP